MRNLIIVILAVSIGSLNIRLTTSFVPPDEPFLPPGSFVPPGGSNNNPNVKYINLGKEYKDIDIDEQMKFAEAAGKKISKGVSPEEEARLIEEVYMAGLKVREKRQFEREQLVQRKLNREKKDRETEKLKAKKPKTKKTEKQVKKKTKENNDEL